MLFRHAALRVNTALDYSKSQGMESMRDTVVIDSKYENT
jgi:hypothetical protein